MSLGKDLATIRKSQHLTLEDIQNAIKIPVRTLQSIEDDSIFAKTDESQTYIRSFVRSYARYLKINDEEIISALDAVEEGNYRGQLLADTQDVSDSESERDYESDSDTEADLDPARFEPSYTPVPDESPAEADRSADEDRTENEDIASDESTYTASEGTGTHAASSASATKPKPSSQSSNIDWADMGKRFNPGASRNKAWVIILIVILISAAGVTGYVYSGEIASLFGGDSTEVAADTESDSENVLPPADSTMADSSEETAARDSSLVNPEVAVQNSTFGDTLTVAVYAAYGILDPVRVTSDFNWRTNPFWMEQGDAYNFDFRDTLLVRGPYSDLILLFNGHIIENPRQNYFSEEYNSIMITRSVLDQPRYLAEPPATFPLDIAPPDTIIYRISF